MKDTRRQVSRGASRRIEKKPVKPPIDWSLPPRLGQTLLGAVLLLGTVGGMTYWLKGEVQRPIAQIDVSGELRQVSADEVKQILLQDMEQGEGLAPDLDKAKAQLLANPWIEQVTMRRRWPDRLSVELAEREAVARWGNKSLVTAGAEVFAPLELDQWTALPRLAGPDGSEALLLSLYHQLEDQLAPYGLSLVSLELEPRGAWQMEMVPVADEAHSIAVYLGRDAMEAKLTRLGLLLRKGLMDRLNEVERIDLRYSNGAALTWAESDKART